MRSFELRCPEMSRGVPMDTRYVHEKSGGQNLSPPLHIDALPAGVRSIALLFVDRDANDFVHWAVADIPVGDGDIRLATGASGSDMPEAARELYNTHQSRGYFGPNPPPGDGDHRYELIAYGLDTDTFDVSEHADAAAFDAAARERAVAVADTYWMFGNG